MCTHVLRLLVWPIYSDLMKSKFSRKKKCLCLEDSTDAQNMFLCFAGFEMLSSHAGFHLNFINLCEGREKDHANTQFLVILPLL